VGTIVSNFNSILNRLHVEPLAISIPDASAASLPALNVVW